MFRLLFTILGIIFVTKICSGLKECYRCGKPDDHGTRKEKDPLLWNSES